MGAPPVPSDEDMAAGRRFFAEHYEADPNVSRKWIEANRDKAIRQLAMLEMAKRQQNEWLRNDPDKAIRDAVEHETREEAA